MHCFFYCLDFYITTAPKIFAISSVTDKNSCHNSARLSACCLHGKINSTIFTYHVLSPVFCLDFYIATAPKIFAIGSHTDKNSCRTFARLSACCLHGKINSTIFTYHALIPCFFVLFFTSLPRRKSLLSVLARTKTPAAISQDCRLVVPASPSTIIHC